MTKEQFDMIVAATGKKFECRQSVSGYYILECDGETIHDDSACEEVNGTLEDALYFFAYILFEEYVPDNKKKLYHGGWLLV